MVSGEICPRLNIVFVAASALLFCGSWSTLAELDAVNDDQRPLHNLSRQAMVMASFNQVRACSF
jgi:hypothetical protein